MTSLQRLEQLELEKNTSLTNRTINDLRYSFYSARSGISSLKTNDHIRAYLRRILSSTNDSLEDLWRAYFANLGMTSKLSFNDMVRDFYTSRGFYYLNDNFTTARSAGSVNGTASEPTGGNRVLVDTGNKVSISNDQGVVASGAASSGNPAVIYANISSSARTRATGNILITEFVTPASGTNAPGRIGWNSSASSGFGSDSINIGSSGNFQTTQNAGLTPTIGTWTADTTYKVAVIQRATGLAYYIKGGAYTNWTLLFMGYTSTTATLYPIFAAITGGSGYKVNWIRYPQTKWISAPYLSDGFSSIFGISDGLGHQETTGIGSGGSGVRYLSNISTGTTTSITPTFGSELLTNTGFEGTYTAGLAPNWLKGGSPTIAESASSYAGSSAQQFTGTVDADRIQQVPSTTQSEWYRLGVYAKRTAGSSGDARVEYFDNTTGNLRSTAITASGYTLYDLSIQCLDTSSASTSNRVVRAVRTTSASAWDTIVVDGASFKPMPITSLIGSPITYGSTNFTASAKITATNGHPAGIFVSLDSTSNPQNYVYAHIDPATNLLVLRKCVGGVCSSITSSTSYAYVAGAELSIAKTGTSYSLFYNGALVTTQTISDAGITSNTIHCLFSTNASNTFSAWQVSDYTTWKTTSAGKLVNNPNLGTELLTNGGFDSATTGWTGNGATLSSVAGGQSGNNLLITTSSTFGYAYQAVTTVVGKFYFVDMYVKNGSVGGYMRVGTTQGGNELAEGSLSSVGAWGRRIFVFRATTTTTYLRIGTNSANAVETVNYDSVSVKPLTLSELFTGATFTTSNVYASVDMTLGQSGAGGSAGLVLNLDSLSNPQSFVLVYHNGEKVIVDKCVSGTYTNQASTTATYSASGKLIAVKLDTSYRILYNNALIGSVLTISDSSIKDNLIHGAFNTYSANTIDNLDIRASGVEGQLNILDSF